MAASAPEIVLEEARRSMDSQQAAIADVRSRAGFVFTMAALISSFMAEPALQGHQGLPWLGWVALGGLLGSAGAAVWALWPRSDVSMDPLPMLEAGWQNDEPDDVSFNLAIAVGQAIQHQDAMLGQLWLAIQVSIAFTALSIAAWAALLASG